MSRRAEGIARLAKAAAPTIVGLIGVVLLALPVRLFWGFFPTPILPLFVVYYWTIFSPGYLPAYSIFLIGLLQDFLTGGPLGLWPAVYLFVQYVISSQRSYFAGRERKVVWVGFAFTTLLASLMVWAIMSLMSGTALLLDTLLIQAAATIAVYPIFSAIFGRVNRRVLLES